MHLANRVCKAGYLQNGAIEKGGVFEGGLFVGFCGGGLLLAIVENGRGNERGKTGGSDVNGMKYCFSDMGLALLVDWGHYGRREKEM